MVAGVRTSLRRNSITALTEFPIKASVLKDSSLSASGLLRLPKVQRGDSDASVAAPRDRPKLSFGNDQELHFDNTKRVTQLKSGIKKNDGRRTSILDKKPSLEFHMPDVAPQDLNKIKKKYRKTGISFASYSADEEDDEVGGGADGPSIAPSQSLLDASPAWVEMKASTVRRH